MSTTIRVTVQSRATLKRLAKEAGKPMQTVLDRALFLYQKELARNNRREAIREFAEQEAGSEWDLDPDWAALNEEGMAER